jgi:hypothetical protein
MLVVAALGSLFTNLEAIVWGAKLRPFDALNHDTADRAATLPESRIVTWT